MPASNTGAKSRAMRGSSFPTQIRTLLRISFLTSAKTARALVGERAGSGAWWYAVCGQRGEACSAPRCCPINDLLLSLNALVNVLLY